MTLRTVLAEIARTSIVVLSTHQTEDVAALCERVIVLDRGRVRYDGPVTDLVRQAAGRVWLADEPDPAASVSWRTGTGRHRNVGAHVRDDVEHTVDPYPAIFHEPQPMQYQPVGLPVWESALAFLSDNAGEV